MWTHKLYRTGGSAMVTVPKDVIREWDRRGAVYARITWEGGAMRVEPYTRELTPCFPPSPPKEVPASGPRDPAAGPD